MKGLRIAKDGSNINDSGYQQYVDTDEPLFKLDQTNNGQRIYDGTTNGPDIFTIPHNLGYVPMNFLFGDRSSNANRKLVTNVDTAFPENTVLWLATTDKENITVVISSSLGFSSPLPAGTFGYNYFIFYDQVNYE